MDRGRFIIDEAEGALSSALASRMAKKHSDICTATVYRPHLDVSALKLFLLADHSSGITRSVAIYMYESVFLSVNMLPDFSEAGREVPQPYRTI